MFMYEFIGQHRPEIVARATRALHDGPPDPAIDAEMSRFLDELVGALEQDAGLPQESPLPATTDAGPAIGERARGGEIPIQKIPRAFGAISDTLGALATSHGQVFSPREYRVFNQCVDSGIAEAIERYWHTSQARGPTSVLERMAFLAHELRNALSSARMGFSLLQNGVVRYGSVTAQIVERSLTRMQDLVAQALLAAQLEAGVKPRKARIDAAGLVRELAAAAVAERGVSVSVDVEDHLVLEGDERFLYSALSNLVQNAIKFTHPNGLVLVRARADGESVVFEVEDECGGLPRGAEGDVFTAFRQLAPDRRGVGLGLSITTEAVEAHGGEITVTNLPGKGCIFAVRIPRSPPITEDVKREQA